MRRKANAKRSRGLFAALVILVPAALGGCATPAPNQLTKLNWPGFDTKFVQPMPAPRVTYASRRAVQPARHTVVARTASPRTPVYATPAQQVPVPEARVEQASVSQVAVSVATAQTTGFVWPVSGRVISQFGNNSHGERNDGINIATKLGEPIRAAASGTVTYTGNELRGYGNLVLIEHDNGYVTAYAHAETIKVARGERVTKGETIGYAGETGDVARPQLHFEIRRGVKPVDPQTLLASISSS